jgi:hypothetical protein
MKSAYRILVRKPQGKRQKIQDMWKDNIKMGFKDIRWNGLNFIHLA